MCVCKTSAVSRRGELSLYINVIVCLESIFLF